MAKYLLQGRNVMEKSTIIKKLAFTHLTSLSSEFLCHPTVKVNKNKV